jgi:hypothetical protein
MISGHQGTELRDLTMTAYMNISSGSPQIVIFIYCNSFAKLNMIANGVVGPQYQ